MKRIDWTIGLGVFVGFSTIGLGAWLDGLNLNFLWNPTALLIVGGGTLGAVIVRRGGGGLASALGAVWDLRHKDHEAEAHQVELAKLAWLTRSAQKQGVKAFEDYADSCADPLVSQGLIFVAENAEKEKIEQVLTRRLDVEHEAGQQDAATLEAAGGFAPTFGVLGAVVGLIGVLRVLDRPEELGTGIATAFVATIYGIGAANLLLFPLGARLRQRHEARMKRREEIAGVIVALREERNPRAIINRFNIG
jgi:chemotaxis protein MotA